MLAAELARIAPMCGPNRVFIGNSGAEVVEAALKLARYHTRRPNLIAFLGAFHGRTYGAVCLTASKAKYHAGFGPLLPGVYHVPFGSAGLDELEQRVFKRLMPADEFAADLRRAHPGRGRLRRPRRRLPARGCARSATGTASSSSPTRSSRAPAAPARCGPSSTGASSPTSCSTAKGIASGMPIGAMIARADVMNWTTGAHGSTYGGNPVALAAMMETIDLLEDGLIDNAAERGEQGLRGLGPLAEHYPDLVRDVRGKGLMIGIQFDSGETAEAVQMQAFERGLLVLEAGDDCVRMSPPLVVSAEEMADRDPDLRRGGRPRRGPSRAGRRRGGGRESRGPHPRGVRHIDAARAAW